MDEASGWRERDWEEMVVVKEEEHNVCCHGVWSMLNIRIRVISQWRQLKWTCQFFAPVVTSPVAYRVLQVSTPRLCIHVYALVVNLTCLYSTQLW